MSEVIGAILLLSAIGILVYSIYGPPERDLPAERKRYRDAKRRAEDLGLISNERVERDPLLIRILRGFLEEGAA